MPTDPLPEGERPRQVICDVCEMPVDPFGAEMWQEGWLCFICVAQSEG